MDLIHVDLAVADVERSVAFYTEQFGFEETAGFEVDGTAHRFVAADNGVELQLTESQHRENAGPGEDGPLQHVAVEVDDVDAVFERIDHHGAVKEPSDGHRGARNAFVLDPDGYTIELVEWLDG